MVLKCRCLTNLSTRPFSLQTMRVVATQASMTLSYFFTDQLESEMKTEERVKKGEMTADEADKYNEDWEDVSIM